MKSDEISSFFTEVRHHAATLLLRYNKYKELSSVSEDYVEPIITVSLIYTEIIIIVNYNAYT